MAIEGTTGTHSGCRPMRWCRRQIRAVVVSPADLRGWAYPPADAFETGPATIETHDWTADLHALIERSMVSRSAKCRSSSYRVSWSSSVIGRPGGGRLKHLREGRLDADVRSDCRWWTCTWRTRVADLEGVTKSRARREPAKRAFTGR